MSGFCLGSLIPGLIERLSRLSYVSRKADYPLTLTDPGGQSEIAVHSSSKMARSTMRPISSFRCECSRV